MRSFIIIMLFPIIAFSQQWQGFNVPFNYNVISTSCYDSVNQYMYVGGNICNNNHGSENHIYRYNGTSWDTLPVILNNVTLTLAMYNNELYIGGAFSLVNGEISNGLAKWNGNNFEYFGNRLNNDVQMLKVINNRLLVGGYFSFADSQPASGLAWYNGTNFTQLPLNSYNLFQPFGAVEYDSMLVIVGNIDDTLNYNIVCLKNNQWIDFLAGGILGSDAAILGVELLDNKLYVGGYFYKNWGNAGNHIQCYNGNTWQGVGGGTTFDGNLNSNGQIHALKVNKGKLYVGGVFNYAGGIPANRLAIWDGSKWCSLGTTFNDWGRVFSIEFYKDTLFVFGNFTEVNGIQALGIAKWLGGNYTDTCSQTFGVSEVLNKTEINIYPNPIQNKELLNIKFSSEKSSTAQVNIYNLLGAIKLKAIEEVVPNENNFSIDISKLTQGMYLLQVILDGKVYSNKVIIK